MAARASTTSISSGFDDDATANGQRSAQRRTASTAPGISGGALPYRSSMRSTTAALISSGVPGTPSSSAM